MGFAAVAVYSLDIAVAENDTDIIGLRVPDTGIGRSRDFAARYRIPQRQSAAEYKVFFIFYGLRHRLSEYRADNFPEPVLRMSVEEVLLSRFYRWKRAEYEHPAVFII